MNKKELIEKIEALPDSSGFIRPKIDKKLVLGLVRELDEPQKPVVAQFVADWIANVKRNGFKFRNSSRFHEEIVSSDDVYRVMYYILREGIAGEAIRIWVNANRDAFARAWLDGYEVNKEKRYLVKLKAVDQYLDSKSQWIETTVDYFTYDSDTCFSQHILENRLTGEIKDKEIE